MYIIYNFFLFCLLLVSSASFAMEFSVIPKNSDTEDICRKMSVTEDGKVQCFLVGARVVQTYNLSDVTIKHKGITIYPYSFNADSLFSSIKNQDCKGLIKNLYGPYYVGHMSESYIYMALVNENGICQKRNLNKALSLYNKIYDRDKSNSMVLERIHSIRIAMSSKGYVFFTSNNEFYECSGIDITDDFIICGNQQDKIQLSEIDSVYYKKQLAYPYRGDWKDYVTEALRQKNCDSINRHLFGPAYMDKLKEVNAFFAAMYESGVCVKKNLQAALQLYKQSDPLNTPYISEKISTISAILQKEKDDRELQARMQRERKMQREKEKYIKRVILEQEWNRANDFCEEKCKISEYKMDEDCYTGCMVGKKQPVKLEQVKEVKSTGN